MTNREAGVAVVVLALLAPVLAFPKAFGPGNVWIVSTVAMLTLAGAVVLLRHFGLVAWLAGLSPVIVPIAGATRVETATSIARARSLQLTPEEEDRLDTAQGLTLRSRLGCQAVLQGDAVVEIVD